MDWIRGPTLGSGSFATVSLATPKNPSLPFHIPVAVKSSDRFTSFLLVNEEHVLNRLGSSCPRIVKCLGHDTTVENGESFYNIFLEYASNGTLADQMKKNQGGRFDEKQVRRYARSVMEGLKHIHENGFIHCDIKLQNMLVFEDGEVKISDFGLAKEKGATVQRGDKKWECRGTPLYMSPESVNDNEYESPADIWAVGCAAVEMLTGKPAWNVKSGSNMWSLLIRIGVGEEIPVIPEDLSEQGKDFLRKCFVKDPRERWTAEMLLNHPFLAEDSHDALIHNEISPRSNFDFPDWDSTSTVTDSAVTTVSSPGDWLPRLVTEQGSPDWSESEGWISVRRRVILEASLAVGS
ncbi:mitogen-activated protein kinase kinase kinase 3-like [Arachis ipaensis]|uniref:mitogen-activated protein kinase kinase kinase 3-like n=1 Tax=Arachis ipaensis TaxID=130454 RepID=UPI0007AF3062|nr:mitogen-activated protein kinase kinase kinase 3-like [Arachis ipaensis]